MKITKKALIATVSSAVALATSTGMAFAASVDVNLNDAGFRISSIGGLITGLLNMVMFVAALLVFAYMIWGGIQWITSGGDKGKTEEARNKITAAIIGLAVVAASYAIFTLVGQFLGIDNPFGDTFNVPTAYDKGKDPSGYDNL